MSNAPTDGSLPDPGASPGDVPATGHAQQTRDYPRQPAPAPKPPDTGTITTPIGTVTTVGGTDTSPPAIPVPPGEPRRAHADPVSAADAIGTAAQSGARKVKLATTWLEGCSGCHMSFLDMDEGLIELSQHVELVYSPLVDNKEFPPDVDVTLVEGAIATDEDVRKMRTIRSRTKVLISLGDCAVTGNVPSMRNSIPLDEVYDRAYDQTAEIQKQRPTTCLPVLLERVRPVHELVKVDVHVPGCPPPADVIYYVLAELLAGRTPDVSKVTRFGR